MAEEEEYAPKTVKDVDAHLFVKAYAAHLKKTGITKEQAPYDADWFYVRAASMARQIYLHKGLGVGAFKRCYGGRKPRGTCKEHFANSSGSVARHVLKQLESAGLVEMNDEGDEKGRKISEVGQRDLDVIAGSLPSAKAIVPDA